MIIQKICRKQTLNYRMMYRIKKNIKYLIIIIVLIFLITILSKNNLTVNFINEEKHERILNQVLNNLINRNKIEKSANKLIKYDFLSLYSNILDCNKNIIEKWSLHNMYTDDKQKFYAEKEPKETHNHRMIRGFLVYFPIEKKTISYQNLNGCLDLGLKCKRLNHIYGEQI